MNTLLLIDCAVFLLLCVPRLVSSGNDDYDPCKAAGHVNGDIAINKEELVRMKRTRRAATSLKHRRWKYGIVPYEFDSSFTGDQKSIMMEAMRHWENISCVTFVEHSHERDYIFFHKGSCGCCSFVGRRGNGKQGISIGNNCDKFGIIVHELGHVVGFWHEHARPDRDNHVRILNKNIQTGEEHNFVKMNRAEIDSFDEDYDFESIMHYAPNTFSKTLKAKTIVPRNVSKYILPKIGQRIKLSDGDIHQVNKMYECAECGGTLQKAFGTLSSPGYPNVNPKPSSCVWRITVNPGEAVVLNVKDFDISASRNCETDFVEIRDGVSTSKLIGKYCGRNKPPKQISSTGNRLWIELKHKGSLRRKGFMFHYKAVCGGTVKLDKGEIQSPNYPLNYEYDKECHWRIVVKKGTKVGIKFSGFDVEAGANCAYDALTIYDGHSSSSPMIKRLCGNTIPDDVISSSNEMLVGFQSDDSVGGKGFALNFYSEVDECSEDNGGCEQICHNTIGGYECACNQSYELHSNGKDCEVGCGGELKGKNGTITSPSYPDKYPKNKMCIWSIRAPPLHQIKLSFKDFEVEKNGAGCEYDYVVVKNKNNSTRLCGHKLPDVMISTSNEMELEFHSDTSVSLKGFKAEYFTDKDECQENNGGCEHDCKNVIGSYECKCWSGYKLEGKHRCLQDVDHHKVREDPTGTITSPDFPQEYDSKLDRTWDIMTTPGHRIKLSFKIIDIEYNGKDCGFDYLEVRSGYQPTSEVLKRVCGHNASLFQPVISKSNEMQLKFHTDSTESHTGFKVVYETVCGGRLHAGPSPHYIMSHVYYPKKNYFPHTECKWHLAAKSGYAIKIKFIEFQLEEQEDCKFDFVKVTDGSDSTGPILGKICGSQAGREFVSKGNNMWLYFKTDYTKAKKGFYLEYRRVRNKI